MPSLQANGRADDYRIREVKEIEMKEYDVSWLMMFGLCLFISWVGAMAVWAVPSSSTQTPSAFGGIFSVMSGVGCLLGWLVGVKSRKEDC